MLHGDHPAVAETSAVTGAVHLVQDRRLDNPGTEEVGMQRVNREVFHGIACSAQRLTQHLAAEHASAAYVPALAAKVVVLQTLELQ